MSKILNLIFCGILSIIVSAIVVVIAIQAVGAKFEPAMLPRLILPIIIVAIPAYIFVYNGLFKKKRK